MIHFSIVVLLNCPISLIFKVFLTNSAISCFIFLVLVDNFYSSVQVLQVLSGHSFNGVIGLSNFIATFSFLFHILLACTTFQTWAQFHQHNYMYSFYMCRSQKSKKDIQIVNLFYAFMIYKLKSCA